MFLLEENTNIVIWGLGNIGSQFVQGEFGRFNIVLGIDSNADRLKSRYGFNIVSPEYIFDTRLSEMIVITIFDWEPVAKLLLDHGMYMFVDYIPYNLIDINCISRDLFKWMNHKDSLAAIKKRAKICMVYGFCVTRMIKQQLLLNASFCEDYFLIDLPQANSKSRYKYLLMDKDIYYSLDVLILGAVIPTKEEGTYSYKTVKNLVNPECKVIVFSNMVFQGYFPQNMGGNPLGVEEFCWRDKNIESLMSQGYSCKEIFDIISAPDFYCKEEVDIIFSKSLKRLYKMEEKCDIGIADYIDKYGRNELLYRSSVHPGEKVMIEMIRRIFIAMGIQIDSLIGAEERIEKLNIHEEMVLPSLLINLGINIADSYKVNHRCDKQYEPVDLYGYITDYYEVFKDIIIRNN